jgi:hypothetical protein
MMAETPRNTSTQTRTAARSNMDEDRLATPSTIAATVPHANASAVTCTVMPSPSKSASKMWP